MFFSKTFLDLFANTIIGNVRCCVTYLAPVYPELLALEVSKILQGDKQPVGMWLDGGGWDKIMRLCVGGCVVVKCLQVAGLSEIVRLCYGG